MAILKCSHLVQVARTSEVIDVAVDVLPVGFKEDVALVYGPVIEEVARECPTPLREVIRRSVRSMVYVAA